MVRWFVCAALFVVSGCAAFNEGLKNAQQGGADPNMAAIPQGQGWFCSTASDMGWHSCARTMDDCKADVENNKKTAMSQGRFDVKFKDCMQAVQAQCFTHEVLEMQSNGSSKPVPGAECMPDQVSCDKLKESFQHQSKYMRVSKCVAAD